MFTKISIFKPLSLVLGLLTLSACASDPSTQSQNVLESEDSASTPVYARHDFRYPSKYLSVLGSKMHYVETEGSGNPILMIHGQPTWSYLWRNIIPEIKGDRRVIAVDLIGFGKSDKPDIEYTIEDHAKYLDGFIKALNLKDVTLVVHDWGSFLGFDYAARNPENVEALAFFEAVVPSDGPEPEDSPNRAIMENFFQIVTQIRTPGVGEKMILEDNFFIEEILLQSPNLNEDEKNAYREPFAKGKNRLPMLQFPRQITFDGVEPKYVVEGISRYTEYLASTDVPKLLLTFSPGALVGQSNINWAKNNMANLELQHIGEGVHFVQEDHPVAIGSAINTWLDSNSL